MDAEGRAVPEGETGEIVYRSPQLLSGYLDDPAATEAAFAGGWFHSGDAGHFDGDGVLWFEDRFKDIIKTGGENVASIEVEKAIYAADSRVQEVAVIGLPHARWGEAVTAVVVPKPGAEIDEAALQAQLRAHLSPFKCRSASSSPRQCRRQRRARCKRPSCGGRWPAPTPAAECPFWQ